LRPTKDHCISAADISMERTQVVTVGYDHCARVWDGFTQEPLLTVFH
jgi:hypothetical protein